jgi:cytochrome b6-f complex iron-sulfur subunit
MKRREFIESTCLAGLAAVVAGNLSSFAALRPVRAQTRSTNGLKEIPIMLVDAPELEKVGGAYRLQIDDLDKDILVVHVSRERYVSVDIKCTHKGCSVEYKPEEKLFQCPCHESAFDFKGVPNGGPATKPLGTYKTYLSGEELIVLMGENGEPTPDDTPIPNPPPKSAE